jgi:aspartyl-tRNA(Asn)/glutamyl-tRNA(Gln) amidotransferase subunit A
MKIMASPNVAHDRPDPSDHRRSARRNEEGRLLRIELTDAYLAAIEAPTGDQCLCEGDAEKAREMAKASDARRIAAGTAGALEGIPLGIKDLFATEGVHTQACSHILDGFKPRYESTVTANSVADGAVMLGKLNMDEFAMGSSNETSYYGPVKNPWRAKGSNKDLVPGGSSGGSAAAVAAHMCAQAPPHRHRRLDPPAGRLYRHRRHQADLWPLLALGHCCLRLVARSGRADCPRRARCGDPAEVHGQVDDKDTTSVDLPVPDYEAAIGGSVKGMKIGIPANTASTACRKRSSAVAAGHRLAEGCRCRDRRHRAAAHQIRAAGLLHRRARRSLVQPGPL